jgi:hypothetical protein
VVLLDPETGKKVTLNKYRHTFFFIPMPYWSGILLALGLWSYFHPYVPLPKGEVVRKGSYLCFSERKTQDALALINASGKSPYLELLPNEDLLERLQALKNHECVPALSDEMFPFRLEVEKEWQEEHKGVVWHLARIHVKEVGQETLEGLDAFESVWLFHPYAGEQDARVRMADGRVW